MAQLLGRGCEEATFGCGTCSLVCGPGEEALSERSHHRDVDAGRELHRCVVCPGGESVTESVEPIMPGALQVERDLGLPAVGAVLERTQTVQALGAGRRGEPHQCADAVVALAKV